MGLADKLKDFIAPEVGEEEELELTEEEAASLSQYEKAQVEGASRITADTNIVLFEPRNFDEAE
ncbi:MAG: cell division protein SepF, partial [Erysipelotrichaceae bacterium]|nr:cell division protein SepF [Erysipelotrichaceae bacterium]